MPLVCPHEFGRQQHGQQQAGAAKRYRGDKPARAAIERATQLIIETCGGQPGPVVEAVATEHLPMRKPVMLRSERATRVLGIALPDERIEAMLKSLGLAVERVADGFRVTPPSFRFDIEIEEDLIEEVARIHGYSKIPEQMPRGEISAAQQPEGRIAPSRMRDHLATRDYVEAINYAFTDAALLAKARDHRRVDQRLG